MGSSPVGCVFFGVSGFTEKTPSWGGGSKRKVKYSPPERIGCSPQPSIVGFDDRTADRQAHSHPVTFCREEWTEYPFDVLRVYSFAIVRNRGAHVATLKKSGFHRQ